MRRDVPGASRCTLPSVGRGIEVWQLRRTSRKSSPVNPAREAFEGAFKERGLPEVIRFDNGTPLASSGATGLTRLSASWICLAIGPERIAPGKTVHTSARAGRCWRRWRRRRRIWPSSGRGSSRTRLSTTRSGRTRRWARGRLHRFTRRARGGRRRGGRSRTTRRTPSGGGSGRTARSSAGEHGLCQRRAGGRGGRPDQSRSGRGGDLLSRTDRRHPARLRPIASPHPRRTNCASSTSVTHPAGLIRHPPHCWTPATI